MERVFRKPKLLRALTSLDAQEFARLEAGLESLLAAERQERTHDGRTRRRAFGCGGATSKLPTVRAKLFFLLFYFKGYPLQEVMGVLFGFGPHALRATAATNALDHEADIAKVQEWLGHANIATARLYDRRRMRLEDSPTFKVAY